MTTNAGASVEETASLLLSGLTGNDEELQENIVDEAEEDGDVGEEVKAADDAEENNDVDDVDEDETEEEAEEELFTISVNGVKQSVTREELINGFQRQKDYTRKTQAVADARREVDSEQAVVAEARAKYVDGLSQIEAALSNSLGNQSEVDLLDQLEKGEITAKEFTLAREKQAIKKNQLQTIQSEIDKENHANAQRSAIHEISLLKAARPELAEPQKAKEVEEFLLRPSQDGGAGFTAEQMGVFTSHQLLMLAADAMAHRAASKNVATAKANGKKSRTIKPGGSKPARSKANERQHQLTRKAQKTGNVKDVAKSLEGFFK